MAALSTFKNSAGVYEIPFLVSMGLSFFFTTALMVALSLAGPALNPKAISLEPRQFSVRPGQIVQIVLLLLIISALYIKFW